MVLRDMLTTENLRKLFKNNFDLVNFAIDLAKYQIQSGKETRLDTLLEKIAKGDIHKLELEMHQEQEEDFEEQ